MSGFPLSLRASVLLCAALLAAPSFAQAGEIKALMKDMKLAMQGAMASTTMPELSGYVARLERDAQQASRQTYRDDQRTYDEGMHALQQQLAEVDQAIRVNDMNGAKKALHQINNTRKHYHHLLS
ncbi:cytochrome b562 [Paraburkholderia sp. A2WS-5]|uniref:cytochrome b562 n=1 Tax=unclassified Paraburkholderia TaxID=2615204 RepID=UPI003B827BB5